MQVKEIYVSRKFNLGNYEMQEVGVTATLAPEDDAHAVYDKCIAFLESKKPAQAASQGRRS